MTAPVNPHAHFVNLETEIFLLRRQLEELEARNTGEWSTLMASVQEDFKDERADRGRGRVTLVLTLLGQLRNDRDEARRQLEEAEQRHNEHLGHVQYFLNELYATMIDPLAEGEMTVKEMCERLLKQAQDDRESLAQLSERDAEILKLRDMIKELLRNCDEKDEFIKSSVALVQKVDSENKKLREALEKIGDHRFCADPACGACAAGIVARAALAPTADKLLGEKT